MHYLSLMGYHAHGVDLSDISIEYSNFIMDYFSSNVSIFKADAFDLPFDNNSIDVVYSIGMIEHFSLSDQMRMCLEMKRVAEKYVVIGIPNYRPCSASYSTLEDGDEDHLECSLEVLAEKLNFKKITYDGRGIFLPASIMDRNESYKSIMMKKFPTEYKEEYSRMDINRLVNLEKTTTPEFRRMHGFVEYFIGEI